MKDKVKGFWGKHKTKVYVVTAAGLGTYLGYRYGSFVQALGLGMCILAEPEVKPLLESAIEKCKAV